MEGQAATSLTTMIKESLAAEGFSPVGIAPAAPHPDDAAAIERWNAAGMNGSMAYLERNNDKRADISLLVPGAQSVIVAALGYFNNDLPDNDDTYFIARYARGRDYHDVIRDRLSRVVALIKKHHPEAVCRVFCDSAPVTEKAWAGRAGLGWKGKNSLIINRDKGSFFLLGEIITDVRLTYDSPFSRDLCGECRKCIDSCPTGAINSDRTIDARRCISYHTIELRGETPPYAVNDNIGRFIFGCDRCQEACPWNKKATRHSVSEFDPSPELLSLTKNDWHNMTPERFEQLFTATPLERPGYRNMMHNINAASGSKTT